MREQLLEFLKKELVGPDPIPPLVQNNGEEIIKEPPRLRYGAGVLFPQAARADGIDAIDLTEQEVLNSSNDEVESTDVPTWLDDIKQELSMGMDDSLDSQDEMLNLANSFLPSAMGFSCFVQIPESGLKIQITTGRYHFRDFFEEDKEGKPLDRKAYYREAIDLDILVPASDIPNHSGQVCEIDLNKDLEPIGLALCIRNRAIGRKAQDGPQLLTFSLVNRRTVDGAIKNEDCFFQVWFSVAASDGSPCFRPYPTKRSRSSKEDDLSNELLYRKRHTYAVGHGCAPVWTESEIGRAVRTTAEVIPAFEMMPIVPNPLSAVSLRMYDLSDCGDSALMMDNLTRLCDLYEAWIDEQAIVAQHELGVPHLLETASRHIRECRRCLSRMRKGVSLLQSDANIRRAFQLMNRAMLLQQLHHNLPLRQWSVDSKGSPCLDDQHQLLPDIDDPNTWPQEHLGDWRPFQIAFLLMNLESMAHPHSEDRRVVDLIWFPTGGGKTEAYLGLIAFSIFLSRLGDRTRTGTIALMRYTLRLLTTQQYQRAAALICACEIIRQDNQHELGPDRFTIGLWVGQSLTPNKWTEAVQAFDLMIQGKSKDNPFIVLKCPWCGAQMGPIEIQRQVKVMGYRKKLHPNRVDLQCHNPECHFCIEPLPLLVVDEEIYQSPPTVLIGTVDKFALLPWVPSARVFFGFRENSQRVPPPELIIQDELHLISGPLGSMVGHYETLIGEMCHNYAETPPTGPKIVASTATISRANEQGHALYNCGRENVFQFPPQCLDVGDSFFAYEEKNVPGRMYVGVHASGIPSHTTAQIRVISALLQGVKSASIVSEEERNPYWTIVEYFNSLRELGHAATLIRADIREYLNAMWGRKKIKKTENQDPRRFVNNVIELTSRVSSGGIPEYLQQLELNYPDHNYPVDICLATNMISVGVDVSRLGLMVVIGQPKTTSEYIQATSRIGRSKDGPGLAVVIYHTGKPRDRSHYEHFCSYHANIYGQVEPTSVTPFSLPVVERALHAILVAFVRCYGTTANRESPQPYPDTTLLQRIRNIISERVAGVDPGQQRRTLRELEERLDEWNRFLPPIYGGFVPQPIDVPLMCPAGSTMPPDWENRVWPTPTSMRSVDASCEARLAQNYTAFDE